MRKNIICLLLVFFFCMSISCQKPDVPQNKNEATNEQDCEEIFHRYSWEEIFIKGGLSSNAIVSITETNLPPLNYEQLSNLLLGGRYKMNRICEEAECCIVVLAGNNGDGKISWHKETFSLLMGIGVTPLHQDYDYEEKYGDKIDRIVMTITIDGIVHTMVENTEFEKMFVSMLSAPIFDSAEGNVSYVSRYSFPEIGVAQVPLSLFDFSQRDCIEAEVNAVFYAGNEVMPIPFAPCTFRLQKITDGYQFVGTDQPVQGYVARENMNCIGE